MAFTLIGTTLPGSESYNFTTTVSKPAGVVAGDLLILVVRARQPYYATPNTPAGWTAVYADTIVGGTGVSTMGLAIYTKIAGSTEPSSYTVAPFSDDVTFSGGANYQSAMLAYRGASIVGSGGAKALSSEANVNHAPVSIALSAAVSGGTALTFAACGFDPLAPFWSFTGTQLWDGAFFTGVRQEPVSASSTYTVPACVHSENRHAGIGATIVLADTVTDGSATTTLGAVAPPEVASFASAIEALAPSSTLAATQLRDTATFSSNTSLAVEREISLQVVSPGDVATFSARAVTPVTPAPAEVATESEHAKVLAQAFGPVTMNGTQPVYAISEASIPRARQQIVVDGVDITYFRGVITPDVSYTLLEPLLYGPGTLDLPQVSACFERPGDGELSWLRPGVTVEVHRVIDDVVVGTDYKGVVVAFDTNGRGLSVELGGEAAGRAALRNRQAVIFPRVNDLGHQIADAVRDLGLPHLPALGAVTGIETLTTGGVGHLEHIQGLVAKAWTRGGGHWTVMPNEATGIYRTFQKDETTIHATAFVDDARTVANLRRDIAEEPNRIYATAVSPRGERIRGGVYPDLNQGPVPPFPGHMGPGSTGEGVRLLVGKLQATNYLRLYEVAGGYDFDVTEAVKDLQDDAGLPQTGEVDEATWNALYDLNITTPSLVSAHIEPFAQRGVVRQKNRSASGTVLGFNDNYDPDVLKVDLNLDMGPGVNRSQVRRFSRAKLHDSNDANWVGDITFHTGALLRGNVAIGATVTEADVMDARELRPGMNIRLPQFAAGKTVHVSACQVASDGTVTATVDTRWRDAMEVWEVIARNKESRNDPARRRNQAARSSTIPKDSIGEWDEVGGKSGHDIKLEAGWNVFELVAAMEGQIARLRIELANPAEFACAVFGRKVDRGFMDDVIGPPLTDAGVKNWRRAGPRGRLRDHWILYSEGTKAEPCGYGSDLKSDGATLTGVHEDEAGFRYRSEDRTRLYVAVWVPAANTIPLGRIMWPQLEAGV